jgi:hypothetical protein
MPLTRPKNRVDNALVSEGEVNKRRFGCEHSGSGRTCYCRRQKAQHARRVMS